MSSKTRGDNGGHHLSTHVSPDGLTPRMVDVGSKVCFASQGYSFVRAHGVCSPSAAASPSVKFGMGSNVADQYSVHRTDDLLFSELQQSYAR